jgi:acetoin utilization protein AcuB
MARPPTIAGVMTPFPHSIGPDASLGDARAMMEEHDIHHLPVMNDGRILGVVSHADVTLAQAVAPGATPNVGALVRNEPYAVDIHSRLDVALRVMSSRRIGSVIVTRHGKLAGILTHNDVSRALADLIVRLAPHHHGADDDDVA